MPLVANSQGVINGSFVIPPNVPAGIRPFVVNGSGGSSGAVAFIGQGVIEHRVLQNVKHIVRKVDPLAQTFSLPEARIITGLDLVFTNIGPAEAANNVTIQIREVENGVPTSNVVGEGIIPYSSIYVKPSPGSQPCLLKQFSHARTGTPNTVYASDKIPWVANSPYVGGPIRSFLQFDLPQISGAQIVGAQLTLRKYNSGLAANWPLIVSRVAAAPWLASTMTWNTPWLSPGGDFITTAQDPTFTFPSGNGKWATVDVTNIVQEWANGQPNHGFVLKAQTEITESAGRGYIRIDNRNDDVRPRLNIQWVHNPVSGPAIDGRWTRCTFNEPLHLEANRTYAIVVLTDDARHAVGIATLGQKVLPGNGNPGHVTSQPYANGVLLSSSNAETWTPHQNSDLTFRLLGARFTSGSRDVDLGTVSAEQLTDFLVQATAFRPDANSTVRFRVTQQSNGETFYVNENEVTKLTTRAVNDSFNVVAELRGTMKMSPYLYPGTLFGGGNLLNSGDYVTRALEASETFNITVNLETSLPGSSAVQVFVENQVRVGGVDQYNANGTPVTEWLAVSADPLFTPKELGGGFFERSFKRTGIRGVGLSRTTRIKLVLTGSPANRPSVRSIAAFTKLP